MMATTSASDLEQRSCDENIPANPAVEASTNDPEVPSNLYKYTKAFVTSAEDALQKLDEASTGAKVIAQGFAVIPDIAKVAGAPTSVSIPGKQMGEGVLYLSKEIFQKINKYKVFASLRTDSSENVKEVFKRLCISTAIETYYAFELQLENVYLVVGDKKNNSLALEILGAFAGERCFDQLLRTGSPENLHRILVPSINNNEGYNFEGEPKTTWSWESLKNTTDDKVTKITSFFKTKLTYQLCLSVPEQFESKRTAASFFDKCFPGFDPKIPEIQSKLKEPKPSLSEIVVDKTKKRKIKSKTEVKQFYYIRFPFKIEVEKIKADNLKKLNIDSSVFDRRPSDFVYKDFSQLAEKIFRKMKDDQPEDITNLISKVESMFSVVKDIDSTTKRTDSNVDEVLKITSKTAEDVAKLKQDLVHEKRNENKLRRVWFQVQDPPDPFVGRKIILEEIQKSVNEEKPGAQLTIISRTHVISGLGGVGKTTIAYKCIQIFQQNYPGCNVVFIHSETQESLKESFAELALELSIIEKKEDFHWERTKSKVYERICDRRCLIVFDNAESLKNEEPRNNGIKKFLPSLPEDLIKNLSILVTTRNSEPASWGNREPIPLDVFTDEEGIEFVKNDLGKHQKKEEDKDIIELVHLFGNLPLALRIVVPIIRHYKKVFVKSGYTIAKFLTEDKIKSLVSKKDAKTNVKENNLDALLDFSLEKILVSDHGKLALLFLNTMAFSNEPDIIELDFFDSVVSANETEESVGEALGLLVKYSLISQFDVAGKGMCYSLHRLVQMVTRERMKENISAILELFVAFSSSEDYPESTFNGVLLRKLMVMFWWVGSSWKDEIAWKLCEEIVRMTMGNGNLFSHRIPSNLYEITNEYVSVLNSRDETLNSLNAAKPKEFVNLHLGGYEPKIGPLNRVQFFFSKSLEFFKQNIKNINMPPHIIANAESCLSIADGIAGDILDASTVPLFVLIGKEKNKLQSFGTNIFATGRTYRPVGKDWCNLDWDNADSRSLFRLLPSKFSIFLHLLFAIYVSEWPNSRKMKHFLGANMFAEIVLGANDPNAGETIKSLLTSVHTGLHGISLT